MDASPAVSLFETFLPKFKQGSRRDVDTLVRLGRPSKSKETPRFASNIRPDDDATLGVCASSFVRWLRQSSESEEELNGPVSVLIVQAKAESSEGDLKLARKASIRTEE